MQSYIQRYHGVVPTGLYERDENNEASIAKFEVVFVVPTGLYERDENYIHAPFSSKGYSLYRPDFMNGMKTQHTC